MKKILLSALLLGLVLSITACGGQPITQIKSENDKNVDIEQKNNEIKPADKPMASETKISSEEEKINSDLNKAGGKMSASLDLEGIKVNITCPTKYGNRFIKSSLGSNGSVANDKFRIAMLINKISIPDYFSTKVDGTYKYMQGNPKKYSQLKTGEQKTITCDSGRKISYQKFNYVNTGAIGTYVKEDVYAITDIGNGFAYEVEITCTGSEISDQMIKEFMDFTIAK